MMSPGQIRWPAPAKLNLFLHVNGRRPDGYHELQTLFIFLNHGDWLAFEPILASDQLTLSPAMCALMLRSHHDKPDIGGRVLNLLLGWFFKLFNKATAPTPGTDIPDMVLEVPAGKCVIFPFERFGYRCGSGIGYTITGAQAVADTAAVAASQVRVAISFV